MKLCLVKRLKDSSKYIFMETFLHCSPFHQKELICMRNFPVIEKWVISTAFACKNT